MTHVLSAVAWPYANGPRHIGHVAGFGVPSDVFSRYMRMAGHDVLMVSGTDEHGTPILVTADKEGVSAQDARRQEQRGHRRRTSSTSGCPTTCSRAPRPATTTAVVQEMFRTCHRNGYMVEQTTQSAISPSTGRTLPDRYIEGTCPICGYGDARGDQCDNCGNQLDATDLIDPRSKINGETPEFVETQHFFLDLPALADALGEWLDEREASGTWRPNVIKFCQNILEEIRPRAMTRDIDWGIPVPGWEDQPTKRLYVWFDAVIGYLSASIEWARRLGRARTGGATGGTTRRPCPTTSWARTTSSSTPRSGRPSCWPTPARATAAASRGSTASSTCRPRSSPRSSSRWATPQFSTSRGHVLYVGDFLARYGPDALRYFICAAGPETSDAAFTWAEFVTRNNSELVAGWGNLVNRTATMIAKNFGEIPPCRRPRAGRRGGAGRGARRLRDGRRPARPPPAAGRHRRGDAGRRRGEQVPHRHRALQDEGRRRSASGWRRSCTSRRSASATATRCSRRSCPHAANKVHLVLGGEGEFMPMPRIEQVDELEPDHGAGLSTYPVITGDYSATPRLGVAAGDGRAPRWTSRRRSSPSSTRRSSTRSWPGWAEP